MRTKQLRIGAVLVAALAWAVSCDGTVEQRNSATSGAFDVGDRDTKRPNVPNVPTPIPGGEDAGPGGVDGGGVTDGGGGGGGTDAGGAKDVTEPPFDAGDCGGVSFGDQALSLRPIDGARADHLHAAATVGGGAIVGWRGSGAIHVAHVDGGGEIVTETTVEGGRLFGLAAHAQGRAVLVSRTPDILALVILDQTGTVVSDQTVIGDVPHDVVENEWFGPLIQVGALTWTGSQWAAYYAVQRLWSDGVAHYGDQLRLYAADGSSHSTVWGWGCSHSMEVAISHNGDRLGPLCSSDCYPSKGVHFNHRGGELWPDESGSNCAGGYGTSLGASVPIPGGFWLAFTATDDRASSDVAIAKVEGSTPQAPIWLTADGVADRGVRATNFGDDVLVAWDSAGDSQFVVVSEADGTTVQGPVTIAAANLPSSSDFFVYANGDVGWVQASSSGAELARLRMCR